MMFFEWPQIISRISLGELFSLGLETSNLPTITTPGEATRGIAMGRDEAGNPIDYQGNRVSVPGRVAPTAAPVKTVYSTTSVRQPQVSIVVPGRVAPTLITYPIQTPVQSTQYPAVITVNPPVRLATPPVTRKNILAMPQGVTNDTLTKLIGLNDSIKNMNIYQTLKVSRSM